MFNSQYSKVIFRLCILCALVTCLWLLSVKSQNRGQFEKEIPVIANQLQAENGVVPVELRCENAELSAPSAIEKLSCVIKNNTNKYISAGTLYTSITMEIGGQETVVSSFDTFDTFLHSDFREERKNNLIGPGKEYILNDLPNSYDNAVIKRINAQIDYIEFNDSSALGPDRGGSRITKNMREGAAMYKVWLVEQYKKRGKSVDAIIPLLNGTYPLQEELGFTNEEQQSGANLYRKYARRVYEDKGKEALIKNLQK
jgi:hypothetical protein